MLQNVRAFIHSALCIGATVLLFVPSVHAQELAALRGLVRAAADGSPVAEAVVKLRSDVTQATHTTATDTGGRYVLSNVRPGSYVLTVERDGFVRHERRVLVAPRAIEAQNVALEIQGPTETVTVATPSPHGNAPSATTLTAERLASLPATQRYILPEALVTLAPGMIRGHDDFVHVRGQEIALNPIINGVSFWENPHALFSSGLSPQIIDTATVVTGTFPAEYGNRFGGVVDIVTRSGANRPLGGSVSGGGGQLGRWHTSADVGGSRGRVGYFMAGSAFGSDRFVSPPADEAIHDSGSSASLFGQIDAGLQEAGNLRIVLMGSGADLDVPKTPLDVVLRPGADARHRTRQQSAIVRWMWTGTDRLVETSVYQRYATMRVLPASGPLTASAAFDQSTTTLGGKIDVTRFLGSHALKTGFDAVRLSPREQLRYDYAGYRELTHLLELPHLHFTETIGFDEADSGGQLSAYAQDAIQIGTRLTADLGVRVDHYDLVTSATHASPRVSLAYLVARDSRLHVSYNRYFVPPPIESVLSSSAGLTSFISEIGEELPPLVPAVEDQVELGLTQGVGPVSLAVTGYHRWTDNPMHTTVWPDARVYSYANFERERAYGMEVSAEAPGLSRLGLSAYANYALARVDFFNPVVAGFVTEPDHLEATNRFLAPMDQTHTVTAGATYRHRPTSLWVGASVEYGSGTPMGHGEAGHDHADGDAHAEDAGHLEATRVPPHFTANVSLGIDLLRGPRRRWSLRLDAENVGNDIYLVAQESEFSPGQYATPRSLSVTVDLEF